MPETEVFYLPKRKTIFVLAGACLLSGLAPLILHFAFSGKYTGDSGTWIPFTLLWILLTASILSWAQFTKLVVSKFGLESHTTLMKRELSWEDVDQVWVRKGFILLLLNKPARPLNSFTSWAYHKKLIKDDLVSFNDFSQLWEGVLSKRFPESIQVVKLEEGTKFPSFHKQR